MIEFLSKYILGFSSRGPFSSLDEMIVASIAGIKQYELKAKLNSNLNKFSSYPHYEIVHSSEQMSINY